MLSMTSGEMTSGEMTSGEMTSGEMTPGESASAFFTDVDRNVSAEHADLGKFIRIAESHGLRFPLPTP
jgi:hypothetical protein